MNAAVAIDPPTPGPTEPRAAADDWVEILLPVHNEAGSIERTMREIYAEISPRVRMRFIISEDGSKDGTPDILKRLSAELPMQLLTGPERKGYSRAVIDGMAKLEAPYLLCLDSDGQCDPKDFWSFWERRREFDLVLGWRTKRQDTWLRRALSGTFKRVYRLLLGVPFKDPSCPYQLISRARLAEFVGNLGVLNQGFWWEFVAHCYRRGFTTCELPVNHRLRLEGETQVYKFRKMPGIGYSHFLGLLQIRRATHPPVSPRQPVSPTNR